MDLVTVTFEEWWQRPKNQRRFWRITYVSNGTDLVAVAVSLGETPCSIFSQILHKLKVYHDQDIGYGNLLEGVRIDGTNQVHLDPNPNIPPEPFASIKKDFLDFERLVTWVENLITIERNVQPAYSSTKFHELCRLLDNNAYYTTVGELRRFGFYMRNNPLFWNEAAKYLFFKKVLTIKEFDRMAFCTNVKLQDIRGWAQHVRNACLRAVRDYDQNRNYLTYREPDGSIVFYRNCLGHLREKNATARYHDAKILHALEDDLPRVIPVWFNALVYLDLDPAMCSTMCGSGWMEFLSMQPSVFT